MQVVHVTNLGNNIVAQATSTELLHCDANTWLKSHSVVNQTGILATDETFEEFGFDEAVEEHEVAEDKEYKSRIRRTMNRVRSGVRM